MLLARLVLKNVVVHGHKISACYFILGLLLCTVKITKVIVRLNHYDNSALTGTFHLKYDYTDRGPRYLPEIQLTWTSGGLFDYTASFMRNSGLKVFKQNFTFSDPIDPAISSNSFNLMGLMPAKRDKNLGTVVVYLIMGDETGDRLSVSLLRTLVDFFSGGTLWSKNIIFVLGQNGSSGVQAFFEGYSGISRSPHMTAESIPLSYSDLHMVILVDIKDSLVSSLNFDSFGMNGRLVLSDILVAFSWVYRERIPNCFQVFTTPATWEMHSLNALSFLWHQLTASAEKQPHSIFLNVGVPAFTISNGNRNQNIEDLNAIGKNIENLMVAAVTVPYKLYFPYNFYVMTGPHTYSPMYLYSKATSMLMIPMCMQAILMFWSFKSMRMTTRWWRYDPIKFGANVRLVVKEIACVLGYAVFVGILSLHKVSLPHVFFAERSHWKMLSDETLVLLIALLVPVVIRGCLGSRLSSWSCKILGMLVILAYTAFCSVFISTHLPCYLLTVWWGTLSVLLFNQRKLMRFVGRVLLIFTCPLVFIATGALLHYIFVTGGDLTSRGLFDVLEAIDLAGVLNRVYREYILYGNYAYAFVSIAAWPLFAVQMAICLIGTLE